MSKPERRPEIRAELDPALHQKVKVRAAKDRVSIARLVSDAIEQYLKGGAK